MTNFMPENENYTLFQLLQKNIVKFVSYGMAHP